MEHADETREVLSRKNVLNGNQDAHHSILEFPQRKVAGLILLISLGIFTFGVTHPIEIGKEIKQPWIALAAMIVWLAVMMCNNLALLFNRRSKLLSILSLFMAAIITVIAFIIAKAEPSGAVYHAYTDIAGAIWMLGSLGASAHDAVD